MLDPLSCLLQLRTLSGNAAQTLLTDQIAGEIQRELVRFIIIHVFVSSSVTNIIRKCCPNTSHRSNSRRDTARDGEVFQERQHHRSRSSLLSHELQVS